jgi:hypothetical protein
MKWVHALKSGAVAGAIYGVFAGIIGMVYLIVMKEQAIQKIQAAIPREANIPMSIDQIYSITMISSLPSAVIFGLIVGAVFGVMFGLMREELLGKNEKFKGLFLALLLLICLVVVEVFSPENMIGGFFMLRFSYLPLAPFSAAAFLVFGYLTGMFWERFEKKKKR